MKMLMALMAGFVGIWIVWNLVVSLVVGGIARAVFPGKEKAGWPMTILLGFIGGIVGRLLFRMLHWPTHFGMGFVAAVAGAFLLLLVHHLWVNAKAAGASR